MSEDTDDFKEYREITSAKIRTSTARIKELEDVGDILVDKVNRLENKLSCQAINFKELLAKKDTLLWQREEQIAYLQGKLNTETTETEAMYKGMRKLRAFRDTVRELIGLTD